MHPLQVLEEAVADPTGVQPRLATRFGMVSSDLYMCVRVCCGQHGVHVLNM